MRVKEHSDRLGIQKLDHIVSDKVIIRLLLGIAFSLFVFCVSARTMISHSSLNSSFNLIYILLTIVAILLLIAKDCVDIGVALCVIAFLGVAIIIQAIGQSEFLFKVSVVGSTMFLPFLTSAIRLPESIFESFLEKFMKGTNVVGCSLVGIGIVDYLSGAAIQMFFARQQIFEIDQARMVFSEHASGIYRYYSFMGVPLENAWYVLAFYALNILYNRYFKILLNEYLVTLVTLVGLVLCGSRTALIIGFLMFIFLNNRKHKIVFAFIMSMMSFGLAMMPVFQKNLMKRFIIGNTSGDISQGRNEAFGRVISGFVEPPEFFTGGGLGYSRRITLLMGGFINSFEYPVMMFSYDFGILGTIIIGVIILIIPVVICLKNKSYFILIFFLAIFIYLNGFNGIANYADGMGQFCFFTMVLVNMSYYLKKRREEGGKG